MEGEYLLNAVKRTLTEALGNEIPCFRERPEQGAPASYLIIHELEQDQIQVGRNRFTRSCLLDIRYHPDARRGTQNRRMAQVRERLLECLHHIETADRPVRASTLRAETVDGVLHVFAAYPLRLMLRVQPQPAMEELTIAEYTKE